MFGLNLSSPSDAFYNFKTHSSEISGLHCSFTFTIVPLAHCGCLAEYWQCMACRDTGLVVIGDSMACAGQLNHEGGL